MGLLAFTPLVAMFLAFIWGWTHDYTDVIPNFDHFAAGDTWYNNGQTIKCIPKAIHHPTTENEISNVVKTVAKAGGKLRIAGSGYSLSPIVCETGCDLVTLHKFTEIIEIGKDTVTVQAGLRLVDLQRALQEKNKTLPTVPHFQKQTVGGSLSTSVHGSSRDYASMSSLVVRMNLVTADGNVRTLSPTDTPELFSAAGVALGTFGIISTVTLKTVPLFNVERRDIGPVPLTSAAQTFKKLVDQDNYALMVWMPYTDVASFIVFGETQKPALEGWPACFQCFKQKVLFTIVRLLQEVSLYFGIAPSVNPILSGALKEQVFPPTPATNAFNQAVKWYPLHTDVEFYVKFADLQGILDKLAAELKPGTLPHVHTFLSVRYVKQENFLLSPTSDGDKITVGLTLFGEGVALESQQPLYNLCKRVFTGDNARLHWGKDVIWSTAELKKLYGTTSWATFKQLRKEIDPTGLFLSEQTAEWFE